MAAVAGSKGRIEPRSEPKPSIQIKAMMALLEGRWNPPQAAAALIASATLREVGIDTNMVCNLACRYCYLSDRKVEQGSVAPDALLAWASGLARASVKLFAFIGKEPLADDRAIGLLEGLDAVRAADRRCFRTGMVTNGTLVERWLPKLEACGLSYLDISVDGLTDRENQLRGEHVTDRIFAGIDAVVGSTLRPRFATATVLTRHSAPTYHEFVATMFARGVVTCFASPVLRFALSNAVAEEAMDGDDLWRLLDRLARIDAPTGAEQIIIDLPYKYSWALLRSGRIDPRAVEEDAYEALHHCIDGTSVVIKLNPFPYSYWRALRLTHDGDAILNMDLAAHPDYGATGMPMAQIDGEIFHSLRPTGLAVLTDAIERFAVADLGELHERDLSGQHFRDLRLRIAA